MVRAGLRLAQRSAKPRVRTVRMPHAERCWLAGGAQYKQTPQLRFDVGVAYIFVDDPKMNQAAGNPAQYGLVSGSFDASVWIVSGQMVYSF